MLFKMEQKQTNTNGVRYQFTFPVDYLDTTLINLSAIGTVTNCSLVLKSFHAKPAEKGPQIVMLKRKSLAWESIGAVFWNFSGMAVSLANGVLTARILDP